MTDLTNQETKDRADAVTKAKDALGASGFTHTAGTSAGDATRKDASTEAPTSDTLLEFEKWAKENACDIDMMGEHYYTDETNLCWGAWQASRSAFAAELVRRLDTYLQKDLPKDRVIGILDVIAIIRQMAGEK